LTVLRDGRESDMSFTDSRALIVNQVLCDRLLGWSGGGEWSSSSTVCGTR